MEKDKVKVGISIGDINGIGIEVLLKCLLDSRMMDICTPIVYGSSKATSFHRKQLNIQDFSFNLITEPHQANAKRANLINCWQEEAKIELGQSTVEAGKYAHMALERATEDVIAKKIDVLVTLPINKHNVQQAGFKFPGHTEFLQAKNGAGQSLMLMIADGIKVGLVTGHLPLKEVANEISEEKISKKIQQLADTLKSDFGIRKPRIAVLGLNPHAGDQGVLGHEEEKIIAPAIEKLHQKGMMVFGPFPADGFFGSQKYKQYDAILAMYHDQGLIPFKSLAGAEGVNFTAGLSFVRTSPAHGTGFDIAGMNKADESSFRAAIYAAIDIFRKKTESQELNSNPLKIHKLSKDRGE